MKKKSLGAKVGWTDANTGAAVQSGFQTAPATATDVTDVAGTLFRSLLDRDALHVMQFDNNQIACYIARVHMETYFLELMRCASYRPIDHPQTRIVLSCL